MLDDATASVMIRRDVLWRWLNSEQACDVGVHGLIRLRMSNRELTRFLSQKIDANELEKEKMPSAMVKVTRGSVGVDFWLAILHIAQSTLCFTQGMAPKRYSRWAGSLMYTSARTE